MLIAWSVLLPLLLQFAREAGMALADPPNPSTPFAYGYALSIWTYPITLGIAFLYRRKRSYLVGLPALNVIAFIISGVLGPLSV
jgi:hypothetical protein